MFTSSMTSKTGKKGLRYQNYVDFGLHYITPSQRIRRKHSPNSKRGRKISFPQLINHWLIDWLIGLRLSSHQHSISCETPMLWTFQQRLQHCGNVGANVASVPVDNVQGWYTLLLSHAKNCCILVPCSWIGTYSCAQQSFLLHPSHSLCNCRVNICCWAEWTCV